MKDRRCLRRLSYLHKALPTKLFSYFCELPPILNSHLNRGFYRALYCRADLNFFISFSINEWNKLDPVIKTLNFHVISCKKLLTFKSICNIYNPQGSKLLSRVRLDFSHLRKCKFRYNFSDTVNTLYSCVLKIKSTDHFFLRCQNYVSLCTALLNEIVSLRAIPFLEVILYSDKKLNDKYNTEHLLQLSIIL